MKLASESICSQMVSTLPMRSPSSPSALANADPLACRGAGGCALGAARLRTWAGHRGFADIAPADADWLLAGLLLAFAFDCAVRPDRKILGSFESALFCSPPKESRMSDLQTRFDATVASSKNLSERPDNATLLKIYGLYKQATSGDNADKKPGFADMVGRAKWDAWSQCKGSSRDEAMQLYIDLIESLS
jgi:acyl-CoA-binding protein